MKMKEKKNKNRSLSVLLLFLRKKKENYTTFYLQFLYFPERMMWWSIEKVSLKKGRRSFVKIERHWTKGDIPFDFLARKRALSVRWDNDRWGHRMQQVELGSFSKKLLELIKLTRESSFYGVTPERMILSNS